jgi:hypothetical protein
MELFCRSLKPLRRARPPVRATRPAARPALSVEKAFGDLAKMIRSRLFFLHDRHPTDPFVPREGREVVPLFKNCRIGHQGFPQIRRYIVDYAAGDHAFGHAIPIIGAFHST